MVSRRYSYVTLMVLSLDMRVSPRSFLNHNYGAMAMAQVIMVSLILLYGVTVRPISMALTHTKVYIEALMENVNGIQTTTATYALTLIT